jgi:hypothetical protein
MRHRYLAAAALGAALAAGLSSAPALASTHPATATPACQLSPTCVEPVEAQSPIAAGNYIRVLDAALTARPFTFTRPLSIDPNNNRQDGRQDFTFQQEGTVPLPLGGRGGFGFTAFDRANYGGSPVYELEWTPFGSESGLCAHDTWLNTIVLRPCNGRVRQAWIVTRHIPLVPAPGSPFYSYALNAQQPHGRQLPTAQHHYCLTGTPGAVAGRVTAARCRSTGALTGTDQQWAALP